jgi:prepilin-type processing-associated H-X9-DG protein
MVRVPAARSKSKKNLKQFGLGCQNFHDSVGHFPCNGTDNAPYPYQWCWGFAILPYIEQSNMYNLVVANPGLATNTGIKIYLCPSRNHTPYATAGGNGNGVSNELGAPHTDYAQNWNTFLNQNQMSFTLTLQQITNGNGTTYTINVGEKSMDPREYSRTNCSNWDECIYSGGYGGTGRGGTGLYQDKVNVNFGNNWGGPHASNAQFGFCDGSVRPISYTQSGTANFNNMMYYLSGAVIIDN